jgi:hypothetical protein
VNWTVSKLTLAHSKPFELSTDFIGLGVHIRNFRDFSLFHVSPSVDSCTAVSCANWVCSVLVFVVFWCLHKASGQIDTGLVLLSQCQQVSQLLNLSFFLCLFLFCVSCLSTEIFNPLKPTGLFTYHQI